MFTDRHEFLDRIKDSYTAYYNINEPEDVGAEGLPLVFRADFFSRGEKYWITKSAKMWANEINEYLYVFSDENFDTETVNKCMDFAIDQTVSLAKPHKEHQYTNALCVFVSDSIDKDALKALKKRSFSKSYNHSFWGYTLLKTLHVNYKTEKMHTNRAGHDLDQFYKQLFKAEAKKQRKLAQAQKQLK